MGVTLRWIGYNVSIHHIIAKRKRQKNCIKGGEKCSNPIYISREGERYFIGE
jgi:hypothetical protein